MAIIGNPWFLLEKKFLAVSVFKKTTKKRKLLVTEDKILYLSLILYLRLTCNFSYPYIFGNRLILLFAQDQNAGCWLQHAVIKGFVLLCLASMAHSLYLNHHYMPFKGYFSMLPKFKITDYIRNKISFNNNKLISTKKRRNMTQLLFDTCQGRGNSHKHVSFQIFP